MLECSQTNIFGIIDLGEMLGSTTALVLTTEILVLCPFSDMKENR